MIFSADKSPRIDASFERRACITATPEDFFVTAHVLFILGIVFFAGGCGLMKFSLLPDIMEGGYSFAYYHLGYMVLITSMGNFIAAVLASVIGAGRGVLRHSLNRNDLGKSL